MINLPSIPILRGEFVAEFADGGTIAALQTGELLELTPPTGQRVRLTHLSTGAGVDQGGISINFGAIEVLPASTISGPEPRADANRFSIGTYQPYAAGFPPSGNHLYVTGKLGEALIITKNAGNTSFPLFYGYEFGE